MNQNHPIELITRQDQLISLCERLTKTSCIALDTEFMREKTYSPEFCLLQIATEELTACIDPLALDSLDPLLDQIYRSDIVKIFHAARQDLEIFYGLRKSIPQPIFDTQVAAPLLGYQDQIGYGNLVKELLSIALPKNHSRTDWSRRPLSQEQLDYAAEDVIYLLQAYKAMSAELEKLGRLEWLADDFDNLADPTLYQNPPEQAWRRIRSAWKLKKNNLSALQLLAEWRERQAQKSNRPRNWIMKDDVLFEIARQLPTNSNTLSGIRGLHERTLQKQGEAILELLNRAKTTEPVSVEIPRKPEDISPEKEALVDILSSMTRLVAAREKINPVTLASKKELNKLLEKPDDCSLLKGWKKAVIGEKLLQFLDGSQSLTIKNRKIVIESIS